MRRRPSKISDRRKRKSGLKKARLSLRRRRKRNR
jgi:hypothetical protein